MPDEVMKLGANGNPSINAGSFNGGYGRPNNFGIQSAEFD
jgi:hypothetical protein